MYKIVLIGAGSQNFGLGIISDIFKCKSLEGSEIILHDINKDNLKLTHNIANEFRENLKANIQIKSTTSRKEALRNANFCIISIEVGHRFDLWDQDWKIPLQYGIKQVYGENGGPGGLFHAMRIIPPILEICDDISKICPDAFVFNFSNPMQRICHAVTTKFPGLKFTGLCHEIASMERQLPTLMETNFSNIKFRAGGLNHFSILLDAKYKDTDIDGYPMIRQKFDAYYSDLVNDHEGFISEAGAERNIFRKLFKEYNYLPITTDSHLGEYLQWAYSVADHEAILDFYDNYKIKCLNFYNDTQYYKHFFDKNNTENHERVIPIIDAILNNTNQEESAVNVPNQGFIECIPDKIVVEVPATLNSNGVQGIKLDNYPKGFGSLLNLQVGVIELTTEAIIKKSKHYAYLALLADPVVDNAPMAEKLLDNIIEKQKEFLGYLK